MFLRDHFSNKIIIYMLGSGRGRVDGLGDALCQFWWYLCSCTGPTRFPGHWCWIGTVRQAWTSIWSLMYRRPALHSLMRVSFLFLYPSPGGLVPPTPLGEVPVRYPWSSGSWWTHWHLSHKCSLHHQYYFPSLFFFPLHILALIAYRVGGPWCILDIP